MTVKYIAYVKTMDYFVDIFLNMLPGNPAIETGHL